MVDLMQTKKVSIIIPSYNVENYIYRGIESCIKQTYNNIEIVIVDDGSTDETWKIVQKYSTLDTRIKAIKKNNGGVSSARNLALQSATGDYVIFLDSDDWIKNNTIEIMVKKIKKNPNLLICCDRSFVYEDNIDKIFPQVTDNHEEIKKNVIECFSTGIGNLQSSCYKIFDLRIIKEKNIFFKENIYHGEDGLFVFEYLNYMQGILYFSECLWNILTRKGSATNSGYNEKWLTAIDAAKIISNYQDFSKQEKVFLSKYCIDRAVAIKTAMLDTKNIPHEDLKKLKVFFDENKKIYFKSNDSFIRKLKIIIFMEFPTKIVFFLYKKVVQGD